MLTKSKSLKKTLILGVSVLALSLAACSTTKETNYSNLPQGSDLQSALSYWGGRYNSNPNDSEAAYAYGRALLASDQRAQAVAVLQRGVISSPNDYALKGALGNALAANGQYQEALNMFQQAHTPDRPNWRILSAQGAVLDQMGRSQEARKYYQTALRIAPDEPSIRSNLAMSYALTGDLGAAEQELRTASKHPNADTRVRQNLALVVGLQGRFDDAEKIARRDLSPAEAEANMRNVRQMLAQQNTWTEIQNGGGAPVSSPAYNAPQVASYNSNQTFAASAPRVNPVRGGALPAASYSNPYGTPVPYGYSPEATPNPVMPPVEERAIQKLREERSDD